MEQFVFEWNAPPTIPAIRPLRTLVYLDFKPLPDNRTELTLRNFGYGDGEEWAKTKCLFRAAWPAVMANLEKRFAPKSRSWIRINGINPGATLTGRVQEGLGVEAE